MSSRGQRLATKALNARSRGSTQRPPHPRAHSAQEDGQASLTVALHELAVSVDWLMGTQSSTPATELVDRMFSETPEDEMDADEGNDDEDEESFSSHSEEEHRNAHTVEQTPDTVESLAGKILDDTELTPTVAMVFHYFRWFIQHKSHYPQILNQFCDIFYKLVVSNIPSTVVNKDRLRETTGSAADKKVSTEAPATSRSSNQKYGVPYLCLAQSFGSLSLGMQQKLQSLSRELSETKTSKEDRESKLIQTLDKIDYLEEQLVQLREDKGENSGQRQQGRDRRSDNSAAHDNLIRKNMELEKQVSKLRSSLAELYREVDVLRNIKGQSHRTANRFFLTEYKRRMKESYLVLSKDVRGRFPDSRKHTHEDETETFDRTTVRESNQDGERLKELNEEVQNTGVASVMVSDLQQSLNDLLDEYDRTNQKPLYQRTEWERQNFATEYEELLLELRSTYIFSCPESGYSLEEMDPLFSRKGRSQGKKESSKLHYTRPWFQSSQTQDQALSQNGRIMYHDDGLGFYVSAEDSKAIRSVPERVVRDMKRFQNKPEELEMKLTTKLIWNKFQQNACRVPLRQRRLGLEVACLILGETMYRKLSIEKREFDLRHRTQVWSALLKDSGTAKSTRRIDVTNIVLGDFLYEYLLDRYILKEASDSVAYSLLYELSLANPTPYIQLLLHSFSGKIEECAWKYYVQCMERLENQGLRVDTCDLSKIVACLYPAPYTPPVSKWISNFKAACADPNKPTSHDLRAYLSNQILEAPQTEPRIGRYLRSLASLPTSLSGYGTMASLIEVLRRTMTTPMPDNIERLIGPFLDMATSNVQYQPTAAVQRMIEALQAKAQEAERANQSQQNQQELQESERPSSSRGRPRHNNEAHIEQLAYVAASIDLLLFEWSDENAST
eukprot:gb/GECG01009348.1/.p1 GENE.gb/GECG01009348.1/~~gb/GECG01009348.1/.p1  ORF type:complete len:899 (+),score=127.08 gb/GECG01009348.1/:1-2697(+)